MSWQQWEWVHSLKDRRHSISQTSRLGCVTVQQQPLIKKKIFFLLCRSIASTEGSRRDVGKVPEQVAAAGVIGERWQGHRACCWQAVGNQSSGTTDRRDSGTGLESQAEQTVIAGWQVPPEQTGNGTRVGVVACSPKLAWGDHSRMTEKPAVPQQTCESPRAPTPEGSRHAAATKLEEDKEKGTLVILLFFIHHWCFAFFLLKESRFERHIWASPSALRTQSSEIEPQRLSILLQPQFYLLCSCVETRYQDG